INHGLGTQTLAEHAGDHVDLVDAGGSNQCVGFWNFAADQISDRGSRTFDYHHVMPLVAPGKGILVAVEHDYIVLFLRQTAGQVLAYFAATENYNFQGKMGKVVSTPQTVEFGERLKVRKNFC